MPAVGRIGDRSTFLALRERGHRVRRGPVAVAWLPEAEGRPRVAYAVGRRVGSAVRRNRVRRRLRAVVREVARCLRPGAYLVSAGPAAADLPYEELRTMVVTALKALAEEPGR